MAASVLSFGAGLAIGAMMSDGCCGWGYSSWNCNWYGGAAVYHGGAYYGNAAWHGGYYGYSGSAYGAYGSAHYGPGYNPSTGTYARGASTSTAFGTQKVGQAYNPYTGAYGATHQDSNANETGGARRSQRTARPLTLNIIECGRFVGTAELQMVTSIAAVNGNAYKNTGSGWDKDTNGSWNSVQKPDGGGSSSDAAHGWGSQSHTAGRRPLVAGVTALAGSAAVVGLHAPPARAAGPAAEALEGVAAGVAGVAEDSVADEV